MGFTLETGVSAAAVFLQGILSFFSPCVLPLVPLYIGYLAGGAKSVDADGTVRYKRGRVMRNTVFFVLGVSFTFFALGLGFSALGRFFSANRALFARIGGEEAVAAVALRPKPQPAGRVQAGGASHLGLGVNPLALYAVADRLRQDPQHWQRFDVRAVEQVLAAGRRIEAA